MEPGAGLFQGTSRPEKDKHGWWETFGTAWLQESNIEEAWSRLQVDTTPDPSFNPFTPENIQGYEEHWHDFTYANNKNHSDWIKSNIDKQRAQRQKLAESGRWLPIFLGSIPSPENIAISVVSPAKGLTVLATAAKSALRFAAAEAVVEYGWRRQFNPEITDQESMITVGAAGLLGGGLVGIGTALGKRAGTVRDAEIPVQLEQALKEYAVEARRGTGQSGGIDISVPADSQLGVTLRSSGFSPDTPIINAEIKGVSPAHMVPDESVSMNLSLFMENLHRIGIMDDNAPAAVAWRAYDEDTFIKIVREGLSQNKRLTELVGLDVKKVDTPDKAEALKKTYDHFNMHILEQMTDPFQGYVAYDRKRLLNLWEQNHKITGIDTQLYPGAKTLRELGLDEPFQNFEEFTEFVLRHEMNHFAALKADRESLAKLEKSGKKFDKKKDHTVPLENLVNELTIRDFKAARTGIPEKQKLEFKEILNRNVSMGEVLTKALGPKRAAEVNERRLVNSPINRLMHRSKSALTQRLTLSIAGDMNVTAAFNKTAAERLGPSIETRTRRWNGRAAVLREEIYKHFREHKGLGAPTSFMGVDAGQIYHRKAIDEYVTEVFTHLAYNRTSQDDAINKSVAELRKFYNDFAIEAGKSGLFDNFNPSKLEANQKLIQREQAQLVGRIELAEQKFKGLPRGDEKAKLGKAISQMQEAEQQLKQHLQDVEDAMVSLDARKYTEDDLNNFFNRRFNTASIRRNKDKFIRMVADSYLDHPTIVVRRWDEQNGVFRNFVVETNGETALERARETTQAILENDGDLSRLAFEGSSIVSRVIPLKNKDFLEVDVGDGVKENFILTNMNSLVNTYAMKMGSKIEFNSMFKTVGKPYISSSDNFKAMVARAMSEERAARTKNGKISKADEELVGKMEKDLMFVMNKVNHTISTSRSSWDRDAVSALKSLTHLSSMGLAGVLSLNELGMVMMRHGFSNTLKALAQEYSPAFQKIREMKKADMKRVGMGLEVELGVWNTRMGEELFESEQLPLVYQKLRQGSDLMFLINGMGPLTVMTKQISHGMNVDRLAYAMYKRVGIQMGPERSAKQLEMDNKLLDQLNLSPAQMKRIERMFTDSDNQVMDVDTGKLYVSTEKWTDREAAAIWDGALHELLDSTILTLGTADRWIMMDGVIHIKKNQFSERILAGSPMDGDYYRVEHPGLSLPFMYLSFALGAQRRIVGPLLRSEFQAPVAGLLVGVGMAYVIGHVRDGIAGRDRTFRDWDQVITQSIFESSAIGILGDYYERSSKFFDAVHQELGGSGDVARPPHTAWMDLNHPLREGFDELTGASISKLVDAGYDVFDGDGELDAVRRALPFNQFLPVKALYQAMLGAFEEEG